MDRQYIKGVGKLQDRLIIILDIEKVLSDSERLTCRRYRGKLHKVIRG